MLLLALVLGFISFGAYGLSYWMPTIVKGVGVSDLANRVINMIPWLAAIVLFWWMTRNPARTADPVKNIALPMFVVALFLTESALFITMPWLSFFCIIVVIMAIFSVQPYFWTLTRFLGGAPRRPDWWQLIHWQIWGGFFGQNTVPAVRELIGNLNAPIYYLGGCMAIGGCHSPDNPIFKAPRPATGEHRYRRFTAKWSAMSNYHASVLSLELTLLKHLSQAGTPMMMSNIAALFELLFNQLFRVKQCLEDEGYLRQDDPRYYHLTRKRLCSQKPLFIAQLAKSDCCQRLMKDFIWRSGFSPARGDPLR